MKETMNIKPIAVDIKTLQMMLGLSKVKAMQVGKDAGAVVNLGIKRTLYNVEKIQNYINSKSSSNTNDFFRGTDAKHPGADTQS